MGCSAVGYGGALRDALLFDLDETLMVEERAAVAAFEATAGVAAQGHDLDPAVLALGARSRARELWCAAPTHDYCKRVGISSWEGLWCKFEGDGPEARALRDWSPAYRREAWTRALADQAIEDPRLAEELAEQFGEERRARHEVFGEVDQALEQLKESHRIALVTNGAACLQREKLAASGLSGYFETVVVSADIGVAKPDAAVFEYALSRLGIDADRAVMVGDSVVKDVDGALAAGLAAVWVNRDGVGAPPNRTDLVAISTLSDLPSALHGL
jgi:putative hydrolase of the HAD superfamily